MSDVYPPHNLSPESSPWGRKVEDTQIKTVNDIESGRINHETLVTITNLRDGVVTAGLERAHRESAALDQHIRNIFGDIGNLKQRLEGHDNMLASHANRLEGHDTLLSGLGSRIQGLENKLSLTQATSLDGLAWVAVGGSTWYWVPPSLGSPMGGDLKWPFPLSLVTDEFGPRPSPGAGGSTNHRGMDFSPGVEIRAAGNGTVVQAGPNGGLGNWVKIRHSATLETGYGHMAPGSPTVSVGQRVTRGQTLGIMGTTGTSTGVHLHFETHVNGVQVNPRSVINGTDTV